MKELITKFATGQEVNPVGDGDSNLVESITGIINAVIAVLGIVCVIVMIIGGVNYMTSSGDAGKVKKAKDTILYGVIGLVICVLAFANLPLAREIYSYWISIFFGASVFSFSNMIVSTPSLSSAFTLFSSSRTCTGSAIVRENSPQ